MTQDRAAHTTARFSVSASDYVNTRARQLAGRWWWLPALPVSALAILGFGDNRLWYLAMMVIFVIYPMILSLTWLKMAAEPSVQWLTRPQRWHVGQQSITIDFFPFECDDDTEPLKTLSFTPADAESGGRLRRIDVAPNDLNIRFLLIPDDELPPGYHPSNL